MPCLLLGFAESECANEKKIIVIIKQKKHILKEHLNHVMNVFFKPTWLQVIRNIPKQKFYSILSF